jgi:hypothetical protein
MNSDEPLTNLINTIKVLYPDETSYERQSLDIIPQTYKISDTKIIGLLANYGIFINSIYDIIQQYGNIDDKKVIPKLQKLSLEINTKLNNLDRNSDTEILFILTELLDNYVNSIIIPYSIYTENISNIPTEEKQPDDDDDADDVTSDTTAQGDPAKTSYIERMFGAIYGYIKENFKSKSTENDASSVTTPSPPKTNINYITEYGPYIGLALIAAACGMSIFLLVILNKQKPKPAEPPPPEYQIQTKNVYIDKNINKQMLYQFIAENLTLIEIYHKNYDRVKVNYRKAYYESLNTSSIQEWTPKLQVFYTICFIIFICIFLYKNTDSWMKKIMILLLIYIMTNAYVLKVIILSIIYLYNILSVRYLYNLK